MAELRNTPVQGRSQDKLERILSAAEKLLNASGPEQITTRQIAEQAGVSVGAVYRLFPDKSAIIRAVVDRYLHEWSTAEVPDVSFDLDDGTDVLDTLVRVFVLRSASLLDTHPGWRRLRTWHYEDTGEQVREPVFRGQVEAVTQVIMLVVPATVPETAEIVAIVTCEATWPLLDRISGSDDPEGFIEEIVVLVKSYLQARLAL